MYPGHGLENWFTAYNGTIVQNDLQRYLLVVVITVTDTLQFTYSTLHLILCRHLLCKLNQPQKMYLAN